MSRWRDTSEERLRLHYALGEINHQEYEVEVMRGSERLTLRITRLLESSKQRAVSRKKRSTKSPKRLEILRIVDVA